MGEHSAPESDGDPWASAVAEVDAMSGTEYARDSDAQPNAQPQALVQYAPLNGSAESSRATPGRPLADAAALQGPTSPLPKRRSQRPWHIREAFADISGSEDEYNREEQLALARSRKVLTRPVARLEAAPLALAGIAGQGGPPQGARAIACAIPPVPTRIMRAISSSSGESGQPLPLQSFVKTVMQHENPPCDPEGHVHRVAAWYCSPGSQSARTATKRAMGASIGVPDRRLGDVTLLFASTVVHCDREMRHTLEALVAGSVDASRLLCYVEFETSDETPMKMAVTHGTRFAAPDGLPTIGDRSTAIPQHSDLPAKGAMEPRRAVVCNILQSPLQFAMLV